MHRLSEKIKALPHNPGIYKFLDSSKNIIYVGKAKSLFNRVNQYFQKNLVDGKTKRLVEEIADLQIVEVFSEIEALILEAELIKKYMPRYNISLKDDKSYLYIVIRKEGQFKRVITARKNDIAKGDISFGPFPDSRTVKYVLRAVRRLFPYRDCSSNKFERYRKLGSPCLYGHINLCPQPCVGKITSIEYQADMLKIVQFLRGKQKSIVEGMRKDMEHHAKQLEYEEAEKVKKELQKFEYIQQSFRDSREFMANPYLVDDIYEMGLKELMGVVPIIDKLPARIECFDVANILGKDAAVSMVVAIDGRIEKREYKKFKIKLKDKPDDVFMLKEVLYRRFLREVHDNLTSWGLPDLVVVDGGKGQVGVANAVLQKLGLDIPVIGLAKKTETIVYGEGEINLEKSSEGLKLLQRLRDESHRFARVYHHTLRSRCSLL